MSYAKKIDHLLAQKELDLLAAAKFLMTAESKATIEGMRSHLNKVGATAEDIQIAARAICLASLFPGGGGTFLFEHIRSPKVTERIAAATACKYKECIPMKTRNQVLSILLEDKDSQVRLAALQSIPLHHPYGASKTIQRLAASDPVRSVKKRAQKILEPSPFKL